jgi:6-phospho-3-hexuloisomerase
MNLSAQGTRALQDIASVFNALPSSSAETLISAIVSARRIAVYGCGREGLAIKGFAMRLFHLGRDVHVIGDMTVPPLGPGDLLIVTSGTGHLPSGESFMQIANAAGAETLVISAQPLGSTPQMASHIVTIPAQTMADDRSAHASLLPMGSLFEFAETLFFELVVLALRDQLGETADTMRARHTNLE